MCFNFTHKDTRIHFHLLTHIHSQRRSTHIHKQTHKHPTASLNLQFHHLRSDLNLQDSKVLCTTLQPWSRWNIISGRTTQLPSRKQTGCAFIKVYGGPVSPWELHSEAEWGHVPDIYHCLPHLVKVSPPTPNPMGSWAEGCQAECCKQPPLSAVHMTVVCMLTRILQESLL